MRFSSYSTFQDTLFTSKGLVNLFLQVICFSAYNISGLQQFVKNLFVSRSWIDSSAVSPNKLLRDQDCISRKAEADKMKNCGGRYAAARPNLTAAV
jgi:hypothetical protein